MKRVFIIIVVAILLIVLLTTGYFIYIKSDVEEPTNIEVKEEKVISYKQAYIEKIQEIEQSKDVSENKTYNLVYINDDNIPELISANNGYSISAYTFKDGKTYTLFEYWPYGAMGNKGYEYIEKENIIRNYNSDFAGLMEYVTFYTIDENLEIKSCYDKDLVKYNFDDVNENGGPDEGEYDENDFKTYSYYYGEKEITEKEYNEYLKDGEYIFLEGIKTASEMKNELEK